MLKGSRKRNVKEDNVNKIIDDEFDDIAGIIAGRIFNGAKKMVEKNMI